MTQLISRLYSSHENVDATVKELKRVGFANRAITVIAPPEHHGAEAAPDAQTLSAMGRAGVMASHATVFASGIARGETLVCVRAPFGYANTAIIIMEKFSPVDTGLDDQGYEKPPPDPAAPFSSWAGWRVLSDNPTPLSSALGWKTLSEHWSRPKLDIELADNPAPLSKTFGMKLLTNKPSILSTKLGWRLLSNNPAPLSTRLGWPLLSRQQKPPQMRFGLPLLSDNPAPLSSKFGWKTLSNNPAPLSSFFGWRVLKK